ncbi:MAG: DUF4012 domain-containing protein [Candidatus Nomurabacteria bacterium]|nr:MAG: DUF4012 domain-containing protein [Candidatus Nomurabacteria bacterium]
MLHSSKSNSTEGVPQQNVLDLRKMLQRPKPAPEVKKKPVQKIVKEQLSSLRPTHFSIEKPKVSMRLPQVSFVYFRRLPGHWRSVLVFAAIALLLLSPMLLSGPVRRLHTAKGEVLAASTQAYAFLQTAGDEASQFEFSKAEDAFNQALSQFQDAQNSFDGIGGSLKTILRIMPFTGSSVTTGEALLTAGQSIARAGQRFSQAAQVLTEQTSQLDPNVEQGTNLQEIFQVLPPALDDISSDIDVALAAIKKVDPKQVPESYRDALEQVRSQLPSFYVAFHRVQSSVHVLSTLFSSGEEKQYALVFQNSNELRPTGGFMGSWALISVRDGRVKVLEVPGRGFLDLNFGSDAPYVPPEPLQLVNPTWQIQDANWWPDFPSSAEKINWFYERARGYQLDGIIAMTPAVVEDLLSLTGSIELPDYDLQVDAESFRTGLQEAVEVTYDKELNQPKQVVGALLPKLLESVFALPTKDLLQVASVLTDSLAHRDILLYSKDVDLQNEIRDLGWAGEVLSAPHDYLQVVEANIGGGKTDGMMQQDISHEVSIQSDGSLEVHLTLHRRNLGDPNDEWTGVKNVSYLRFYVPEGSRFLSAEGFTAIGPGRQQRVPSDAQSDPTSAGLEQIDAEDALSHTQISHGFAKTIFGNWLELGPGEEVTATISYQLPFTWDDVRKDGYSLYVQQQAGTSQRTLLSSFSFPESFTPNWSSPTGGEVYRLGNSVRFSAPLVMDQSYALSFTKR